MGNFGRILFKNYASYYLRTHSNEILETLQHNRTLQEDKSHINEIYKKQNLLREKVLILGPFLPKIIQVNISKSALINFWRIDSITGHNRKSHNWSFLKTVLLGQRRNFLKLFSLIGYNRWTKVEWNFPNNSLLRQSNNFGSNFPNKTHKLYLKVCYNKFVAILQHNRAW